MPWQTPISPSNKYCLCSGHVRTEQSSSSGARIKRGSRGSGRKRLLVSPSRASGSNSSLGRASALPANVLRAYIRIHNFVRQSCRPSTTYPTASRDACRHAEPCMLAQKGSKQNDRTSPPAHGGLGYWPMDDAACRCSGARRSLYRRRPSNSRRPGCRGRSHGRIGRRLQRRPDPDQFRTAKPPACRLS
jgi:hypothetical protein